MGAHGASKCAAPVFSAAGPHPHPPLLCRGACRLGSQSQLQRPKAEIASQFTSFVIPAKTGIQWTVVIAGRWMRCLDSRLRGNDDSFAIATASQGGEKSFKHWPLPAACPKLWPMALQ